jgi:Calcineurin-like phosphoesterase
MVRLGCEYILMVKVSNEEFISLWERLHSPARISEVSGLNIRQVYRRKKELIEHGLIHEGSNEHNPARHHIEVTDGTVIVFSDAHYTPGPPTTAHKALLLFIKQFHPEVIIGNGDLFDGGSISRYPRIGWDNKPTVKQEIDAVLERTGEIEALSKGKLIWTLGNHDARYETFLAANAPQYEGIHGFSLKDSFPRWKPCWSCWINGDTVVKHNWKGGIHATHNNTVGSGVNIITGHLHSLKVTPYSDYNGTRYGVDTGTLADPYGPQFVDYTQDNPVNWRSGFAVLTFRDGKLLPPELVQVWEESSVTFRGAIIDV